MFLLIIDTALSKGFVSLFKDQHQLNTAFFQGPMQSRDLLPSIHRLLSQHQISLSDLSSIAVNIGPGSFTGTRVGVMTAKSLSFALHIPLIPYHSMMGYLHSPLCPLIDAKQKRCFTLIDKSPSLIHEEEILMRSTESFISPDPMPILKKFPSLKILKQDPNIEWVFEAISQACPLENQEACEILYLTNP